MGRITSKLTYANVIASIALFAVLGGGAWAAGQLDKNTVVSRSIKNQAVRSADIKNNNVRTQDLKDGSLQTGDVKDETLQSQDVQDGTLRTRDLGDGVVPEVDEDPTATYYDNSALTSFTQPGSRVLEVEVPAGTYTAHVDLLVYQAVGATGQGDCRFRAPADASPVLLGYTGTLFLGDQPNMIDQRFISMGGAFSTEGGVVEMFCSGDLETQTGDLIVTEVSSIDNQG